jgi:hypothetical protein
VKRIAPICIVCFGLCGACGALGQSEGLSAALTQELHASSGLDAQRQELLPQTSLPDAPSVQLLNQLERLPAFIDELRSPLTPRAPGINVDVMGKTEVGQGSHRSRPNFAVPYEAVSTQKGQGAFLNKYLYPSLVSKNLRYHPSTSVSFMGRATDAASRIFVTRDAAGKKRLNTPYFLGMLGSMAIHSARSPYWTRTASAPFNDLGSTIGNNAGVNLLHEFGPGIRQMVKDHMPKFVVRIEERITPERNPRGAISTTVR